MTTAGGEPPPSLITTAPPTDPETPQAEGRRKPGRQTPYPPAAVQNNQGAVEAPPPEAFPRDQIPLTDRWRLVDSLGLVKSRWLDPYNQNVLKGDRPLKGTKDWFLLLSAISDSVVEPRSFPQPVGSQTTQRPGSNDTIGKSNSFAGSQTFLAGAALIKGLTAFKPPELEVRVTLGFNYNYAQVDERRILFIQPSKPPQRSDAFVGVQEALIEYHIRNVSDRYDFDAIRVGIQPFSTDFRGFLFQDNQLGVRLFGDRDNNRLQYNLAVFQRIEKDTNSGLNDLGQPLRRDWVFVANAYRQDLPLPGMTSQATIVWNANRERGEAKFDTDGFPVRPALIGNDQSRNYDAVYFGYNADGHYGRLNLTSSIYGLVGRDRNNVFTGKPADLRAFFFAAEPSYDFSWTRVRLSGLYASGNHNPRGKTETGFDAILENPQFAGADTSYWIRQSVPFIGGGRNIGLSGRNGVLVDLRSSKDQGQSNFNNPGTALLGVGADFDLTPTVRLSGNLNHLWFADTAVLNVLRQQSGTSKDLGFDYSAALIWRPKMTQNVVVRGSFAVLQPGTGFNQLFEAKDRTNVFYSGLLNVVLSY